MLWTDRCEVAMVQCDDNLGTETLSQGDHGGVGAAQGKIGILFDKLSDARPVPGKGGLNIEAFEPPQETSFGLGPSALMDQVCGFRDAKSRNHEMEAGPLQDREAGVVRRVG